ncbi:MAG: hypothetical protein KME64_09340 [Scytonematopsis contorta HA4267-MV1]|jgi:hypothetical protein|nr:hypothetical protein [Scytonematopsis contorta HA4267-MV1]
MSADDSKPIKDNREYLVKQSEMLQATITRMASNSLAVKQLGLSIWTALVGFGFTNKTPSLFILAIISLILIALLDMYYLYLETRFRNNFNRLTELLCGFDDHAMESMQRLKGNFVKLENISIGKEFQMYTSTFRSWANLPYLVIIVITLVIFVNN